MHFKDKSFCPVTDCPITDCHRNLTPALLKEAREWWGNDNVPICFDDHWKHCERREEFKQ